MESFALVLNTIFLIYYVFYTIQYVKFFGFYFILFVPVYLNQFWLILSAYFFDLGDVYTFESQYTSTISFSTTYLILSNLFFFGITRYSLIKLKFLTNNKFSNFIILNDGSRFRYDLLLFLVVIFNFSIIGYMIAFGVPLTSGVNRVEYASSLMSLPFLKIVYSYYLSVMFFLGILLSKTIQNGYRKFLVLSQIILVFMLSILEGNKFSRIFDISLLLLFAPAVLNVLNNIERKLIIKVFFGVLIFFVCLISYHSVIYEYVLSTSESGTVLGYLAQRIFVLQGGIWWKSYNMVITNGIFDFSHLQVEIQNLYSTVQGYTGLKYLMLYTSEGDLVAKLLDSETGFEYSGGSPALFLVTFGPFFYWPVLGVLSCTYAVLIYFFKKLIINGHLLGLFFFIAFFQTYQNFIVSGEFDSFFILGNLYRILIFLFLSFIEGYYSIFKNKI